MTDSWWLKFRRAQKHMVDVRTEARRYAESRPYEFTRIRQPDSQLSIRFRLRITEQPDPVLALILGDFVHNLRSALDHVIVASVPKRHRSNATRFPIAYVDLFAKNADGEFVVNDAEARANFERSIKGLDPRARTLVILAQPYHLGDEADTWTLGIIHRLDNADKHRKLMAIGGGIQNPIATVPVVGNPKHQLDHGLDRYTFLKDGSTIGWKLPDNWRSPDYPAPSEVQMEYSGTAVVHIKVTGVRGNESLSDYPLYLTMLSALSGVRRLLRVLELFVIK